MNDIAPKVGRLCDIPHPLYKNATLRARIVSFDDETICVATLSDGHAGDEIWDLKWLAARDVVCVAGETCTE